MNYDIDDFTDEDYSKAADEALSRPSDASFWDDRLYTTHGGPIVSYAPDSDDLVGESNYHTTLAYLQGVAEEHGEDDAVIDGQVKHWTYPYFKVLYVQVRDDEGNFTRTFKEAVAVAHGLRDYPLFDEEDYSSREWEQSERLFEETLSEVADTHEFDEQSDRDFIKENLYERREDLLPNFPYDVVWDDVVTAYRQVREDYFIRRANQEGFAPLTGQLVIQ
jgi:hypothetical protein